MGPFLGEKETVETGSAGAAAMWREPSGRQFDGGFPVLPNMQNPDDTYLATPGILALLAFPRWKRCTPREKQADCLFFIKWRGGKTPSPVQNCSTVQTCMLPLKDPMTVRKIEYDFAPCEF